MFLPTGSSIARASTLPLFKAFTSSAVVFKYTISAFGVNSAKISGKFAPVKTPILLFFTSSKVFEADSDAPPFSVSPEAPLDEPELPFGESFSEAASFTMAVFSTSNRISEKGTISSRSSV